MRLVRALCALALGGGAALAAPPPPPIYPSELPKELNGYDLRPIYQRYHLWVGRGREEALRRAVPHQKEWRGKRNWGEIVFSKINHYDFGVLRVDLLERYCTGDRFRNEPAGDCEHRYRYAFVPGSLYSDASREKLIQQSFRPSELTELLKREGWSHPGQNGIWSDSRIIQVFERHTDLAALYRPNVEAHDVAETDCPGLKQSLAGLDQLALTIDPDQQGELEVPAPHGQSTEIRLTATTPAGGRVAIEGSDPLYKLLQPIWDAVETCSPPSYKKERAN
ncbi:MAG TPA: hypothetical protein VEB39_01365 [Sphingomicrobium sp.]|nr:hypothetical protein [Sphingomicrobium sp.]